jgi:N6-adenosine-specific RNA methylase IME4
MGFWYRNHIEILMVGVHGVKPFRSSRENVHTEANTGHSVKPDEFYTYIEGNAPGPYLELFATRPRENWTSVGLTLGTEVVQWFDSRSR